MREIWGRGMLQIPTTSLNDEECQKALSASCVVCEHIDVEIKTSDPGNNNDQQLTGLGGLAKKAFTIVSENAATLLPLLANYGRSVSPNLATAGKHRSLGGNGDYERGRERDKEKERLVCMQISRAFDWPPSRGDVLLELFLGSIFFKSPSSEHASTGTDSGSFSSRAIITSTEDALGSRRTALTFGSKSHPVNTSVGRRGLGNSDLSLRPGLRDPRGATTTTHWSKDLGTARMSSWKSSCMAGLEAARFMRWRLRLRTHTCADALPALAQTQLPPFEVLLDTQTFTLLMSSEAFTFVRTTSIFLDGLFQSVSLEDVESYELLLREMSDSFIEMSETDTDPIAYANETETLWRRYFKVPGRLKAVQMLIEERCDCLIIKEDHNRMLILDHFIDAFESVLGLTPPQRTNDEAAQEMRGCLHSGAPIKALPSAETASGECGVAATLPQLERVPSAQTPHPTRLKSLPSCNESQTGSSLTAMKADSRGYKHLALHSLRPVCSTILLRHFAADIYPLALTIDVNKSKITAKFGLAASDQIILPSKVSQLLQGVTLLASMDNSLETSPFELHHKADDLEVRLGRAYLLQSRVRAVEVALKALGITSTEAKSPLNELIAELAGDREGRDSSDKRADGDDMARPACCKAALLGSAIEDVIRIHFGGTSRLTIDRAVGSLKSLTAHENRRQRSLLAKLAPSARQTVRHSQSQRTQRHGPSGIRDCDGDTDLAVTAPNPGSDEPQLNVPDRKANIEIDGINEEGRGPVDSGGRDGTDRTKLRHSSQDNVKTGPQVAKPKRRALNLNPGATPAIKLPGRRRRLGQSQADEAVVSDTSSAENVPPNGAARRNRSNRIKEDAGTGEADERVQTDIPSVVKMCVRSLFDGRLRVGFVGRFRTVNIQHSLPVSVLTTLIASEGPAIVYGRQVLQSLKRNVDVFILSCFIYEEYTDFCLLTHRLPSHTRRSLYAAVFACVEEDNCRTLQWLNDVARYRTSPAAPYIFAKKSREQASNAGDLDLLKWNESVDVASAPFTSDLHHFEFFANDSTQPSANLFLLNVCEDESTFDCALHPHLLPLLITSSSTKETRSITRSRSKAAQNKDVANNSLLASDVPFSIAIGESLARLVKSPLLNLLRGGILGLMALETILQTNSASTRQNAVTVLFVLPKGCCLHEPFSHPVNVLAAAATGPKHPKSGAIERLLQVFEVLKHTFVKMKSRRNDLRFQCLRTSGVSHMWLEDSYKSAMALDHHFYAAEENHAPSPHGPLMLCNSDFTEPWGLSHRAPPAATRTSSISDGMDDFDGTLANLPSHANLASAKTYPFALAQPSFWVSREEPAEAANSGLSQSSVLRPPQPAMNARRPTLELKPVAVSTLPSGGSQLLQTTENSLDQSSRDEAHCRSTLNSKAHTPGTKRSRNNFEQTELQAQPNKVPRRLATPYEASACI